ncbi:hypothetical protein HX837_07290 [Marine Group I thaumarchaeote]|uniref:Uncharacterized protein n=1 Tax=Marine Group I thaumarchaeote TaxID=2511932 RepID=A0A7K4MSV7_9ARCH|nr:hypothetical protein [Marine Group I thaumarchaeote]
MTTGENAGDWGTKTNTNWGIIEQAFGGYVAKSIAGGVQTTTLTITDGDATASTSIARHQVIKLTGTITGNQTVTVPDDMLKTYIVVNGTSGAYTVQFKTASGSGITFSTTDKGTKHFFADGTNIVDIGISTNLITGGGTEDITLDSPADIVIDAAGGNVEFKDAGTTQLLLDMDTTSGVQIIQLKVNSDDLVFQQYDGNEVVRISDDRRLYFYDKGGEYIYGDGTDLNITSGADINIPSTIGLTFGNDGEKIEGDGTDLTITGNTINLTATTDVALAVNTGLLFAGTEKIESDGTDLSITVGGSGDINIGSNIGLTFGDDGEKIEGDGTDLTIAGNTINLTAVTDVVIPNSVGIQFGGASEKIEGDGTDLTISANNLTIDAAADIILDAAGNNLTFKSGGTAILDISNSSNDAVIQQQVNGYDIIFKQYDGNTLLTIDDAGFVGVHNAAAGPGELRIYEDTDNGVLYSGFKAGNVTTSVSWVLPLADGSADYVLATDGSGTLSWAAQTASSLAADDISVGDAAVTIGNASTSADVTLDSGADVVIDAAGGNVEFKDAGTLQLSLDMDGTSGVQIIKLGVNSDDLVFQQYDGNEVMRIKDDRKLYFYDDGGENISSDGTDFTFASGNDINLTATTDINVPSDVGITFGDDAEKIEGDGTDLTITGNTINLTATTDVALAVNTGLLLAGTEKIESDGTDLSITVGAGGDINIGSAIGLTFGDDGEKIEGDGTNLTISTSNNVTVDAAADIILDAGGADITLKDDGTQFGSLTNTSGNLIIKSGSTTALTFSGANATLAGDLTISGDDLTMGTNTSGAVLVADGTNFNPVVISGDVSIGTTGTAAIGSGVIVNADVNASAAIVDSKLATISTADKVSGAAIQIDGATDGTSITLADADKILVDDGGTTKYITASQLNTYTSTSIAADDIGAGNAAVSLATSSGAVTIDSNASSVTVDGHTGVTLQSSNSGDITLDSVADINLDAGGADILLKDDGTTFGGLINTSGNLIIKSGTTTAATFSGANVTLAGTVGSGAITSTGTVQGTTITATTAFAGTLSTAAQTNITSLGTLTALTIDDVAINGKVVTMTGSSSDTAVFTAGTNGTLDITTTDAAAAAANIQITADGTAELAGTTVTLDSAGDIELEATNDINVPTDVGMTFGDDGEKIEGDGTDLKITSSRYINFAAEGTTNQIQITDGAILPITDDDVDLGSASYQFKNAYFDGTLEADAITIGGTAVTAGGATKGFAIAVAIAL